MGRGQASLSSWIHGDAVDTRYGVHASGITALAHAGDTFNRDTKPQVFGDAVYLQWLVARQLVKAGSILFDVLPGLSRLRGTVASGPTHVLEAMGLDKEECSSSIRFSLGRFTTEEEILYAIKKITSTINFIRTSND